MSKNKEATFNTIHDGNALSVWEDGEFVYMDLYLNGCTLVFPHDYWDEIRNDFSSMQLKDFTELN